MREILFRAKAINRNPNMQYRTDYKNGDWVYGLVSSDCKYHDTHFTEMTNTDDISGIDVDRETVCEYTGLTDKNGAKIFEGDIVEVDGYREAVHFKNGCFYPMGAYIARTGYEYDPDEYEVVGNIYDTPELLEIKK